MKVQKITRKDAINLSENAGHMCGHINLFNKRTISEIREELQNFIGFEPENFSKSRNWDGKSRYEWIFKDSLNRVGVVYTWFDDEVHFGGSAALLRELFGNKAIVQPSWNYKEG